MKSAIITKFMLLMIISMSYLFLASCSSKSAGSEPFKNFSARQLFEHGETALASGENKSAITFFETLDARYPFSEYSEQSQLDIIYAYYRSGDNPSTVAAAERYIQLYPAKAHVEYAYYMKGLANFEQDRGILLRYFPINEAHRDLGTATDSYQDFKTLIERFPRSRYAADARQRMMYLRNALAEHELAVAEFYLDRHAYVAAINRASNLLRNYPHTNSTKGALVVLVKANRILGMTKEADYALKILRLNYPRSSELKELENKKSNKGSFFSVFTGEGKV